jgi:hypothetical protein
LRAACNPGGPAAQRAIECLIGKCIGTTVLLTRHMACTPMREARQAFQRLIAEWSKFGVAHTPTALKLLNDKLAIQEQVNLTCAKFRSEVNRRNNRTPLCDVVCRRADRCGD